MKQPCVGKPAKRAGLPTPAPTERLRTILERYERKACAEATSFEGVSVEVSRQAGFSNHAITPRGLRLTMDEPVSFGGGGLAPDPAECFLAAVGASVSVTLTAYGALREVSIDRVHVALTSSIDARQFFRPGSGGRPGLLDTTLTVTVASSAPRQSVRTVLREALRVAPVFRSLKRKPQVRLVFDPDFAIANDGLLLRPHR